MTIFNVTLKIIAILKWDKIKDRSEKNVKTEIQQFIIQFAKQNLPACEDKITLKTGMNVLRFLKFFCREICIKFAFERSE